MLWKLTTIIQKSKKQSKTKDTHLNSFLLYFLSFCVWFQKTNKTVIYLFPYCKITCEVFKKCGEERRRFRNTSLIISLFINNLVYLTSKKQIKVKNLLNLILTHFRHYKFSFGKLKKHWFLLFTLTPFHLVDTFSFSINI